MATVIGSNKSGNSVMTTLATRPLTGNPVAQGESVVLVSLV
jgi:hypothetical protein